MKRKFFTCVAVAILLSCSKVGGSSDAPLAKIAKEQLLMEGSLIDRSPSQNFASQMHERNENLDKAKDDILNKEIETEIDEGMGLKLAEPFKITSIEYLGSNNVTVEMESMAEINEEGVSQREVRFPQPGSPCPIVAVGLNNDGESCVPIFLKFKGVEGNKGSQYDQNFTLGDKFRLVSSFQITAADAKRWGRVVKICVTGIGSPDFNGPVEEMNAERNEYYQKYGR